MDAGVSLLPEDRYEFSVRTPQSPLLRPLRQVPSLVRCLVDEQLLVPGSEAFYSTQKLAAGAAQSHLGLRRRCIHYMEVGVPGSILLSTRRSGSSPDGCQ